MRALPTRCTSATSCSSSRSSASCSTASTGSFARGRPTRRPSKSGWRRYFSHTAWRPTCTCTWPSLPRGFARITCMSTGSARWSPISCCRCAPAAHPKLAVHPPPTRRANRAARSGQLPPWHAAPTASLPCRPVPAATLIRRGLLQLGHHARGMAPEPRQGRGGARGLRCAVGAEGCARPGVMGTFAVAVLARAQPQRRRPSTVGAHGHPERRPAVPARPARPLARLLPAAHPAPRAVEHDGELVRVELHLKAAAGGRGLLRAVGGPAGGTCRPRRHVARPARRAGHGPPRQQRIHRLPGGVRRAVPPAGDGPGGAQRHDRGLWRRRRQEDAAQGEAGVFGGHPDGASGGAAERRPLRPCWGAHRGPAARVW